MLMPSARRARRVPRADLSPDVPYAIDVSTPLAYRSNVVFIETPVFTRHVKEVLTDDQYAMLQSALIAQPHCGNLIRGGRGIRTMYAKGEQTNLTSKQVRQLASYVETLK